MPVGNNDSPAHDLFEQSSDDLAGDFSKCNQACTIGTVEPPEMTHCLGKWYYVFSAGRPVFLTPLIDSLLLLNENVCVVGDSEFNLNSTDAQNAEQDCALQSPTPRLVLENSKSVSHIPPAARLQGTGNTLQMTMPRRKVSLGPTTTEVVRSKYQIRTMTIMPESPMRLPSTTVMVNLHI